MQPSSYDGYDVHFDCPGGKYGGMPVVVLRGHGTKELPQFGGKGHPLGPELEKQFFSLAEEARRVADAPSIHHVAGVPPCRTTGWVIGLELSDYRDVDAAIRNLGTWLVREGLGGEVVLWLLPVGPERHL